MRLVDNPITHAPYMVNFYGLSERIVKLSCCWLGFPFQRPLFSR